MGTAANPVTRLDGNHVHFDLVGARVILLAPPQGDLDELSNFLHPFWALEDSFVFRLLQGWDSLRKLSVH
jgi:hypothetical protein